jgi:hypothetical protein
VTALARDVSGAHVLSDGRDIYGAGYTDCVLTAQRAILERDPAAVRPSTKPSCRRSTPLKLIAKANRRRLRPRPDDHAGAQYLQPEPRLLHDLLIGLIGFVFDYALRLLQRRVLYWVPNGHGRLGGG